MHIRHMRMYTHIYKKLATSSYLQPYMSLVASNMQVIFPQAYYERTVQEMQDHITIIHNELAFRIKMRIFFFVRVYRYVVKVHVYTCMGVDRWGPGGSTPPALFACHNTCMNIWSNYTFYGSLGSIFNKEFKYKQRQSMFIWKSFVFTIKVNIPSPLSKNTAKQLRSPPTPMYTCMFLLIHIPQ
eukprot:TRINITY_DN5708_c1_g1_i6.p4 TRINITY_DN5708_c1_g1~~TRINITY_DN5708_c1_g1_i6.p4  ORF type:complete len:215 (-),score=-20.45 TRINITY_DN5708_c1_g1_i6:816-1367(-)